MKKSSWKLILIIVAGILAVVMLGVFGVQSSQNKAFSLEEQVNTADSDIKVQEKRRVDAVWNGKIYTLAKMITRSCSAYPTPVRSIVNI